MSRSGCYIVSPGVTKSGTAGNKRAVLKVGSHAIIIFCGSTSGWILIGSSGSHDMVCAHSKKYISWGFSPLPPSFSLSGVPLSTSASLYCFFSFSHPLTSSLLVVVALSLYRVVLTPLLWPPFLFASLFILVYSCRVKNLYCHFIIFWTPLFLTSFPHVLALPQVLPFFYS